MTERRSFYAYLQKQRGRAGIAGKVAREALGTGRHFTCWGLRDFMMIHYGGLDPEHDGVAQLIREYEQSRDEAVSA
jgi:hypothetical protein